jgi:hypothetical protein
VQSEWFSWLQKLGQEPENQENFASFGQKHEIFRFTKKSKPAMGPSQPSINLLLAAFSQVDKTIGA